MLASIIIPYHERKEHLQLVLEALGKQTTCPSDYEIIVIDDASAQKVHDIRTANVACISLQKRSGAATARNRGLDLAKGEIVIFLDSDMVVDPAFVAMHIDFHRRNANVLALGPRLHMSQDGNVQSQDTRLKLLSRYKKDITEMRHPWFMTYTCNVSLKRKNAALERFDENYFFWGLEDSEWAYRHYLRGCRFAFIEKAAALHLYHDRSMTYEKFSGWQKNLDYTVGKHPELKILQNFKDVFDPGKQADYFKTYDKFEETACDFP